MGTPQAAPETTIYEVELVDIEAGPPTPPDVAAPPPDARKTSTGVAYTKVRPGTGKEKPRFHDYVQFNFSAWTATGRLVDSTVVTKQPKATFLFREPPAAQIVPDAFQHHRRERPREDRAQERDIVTRDLILERAGSRRHDDALAGLQRRPEVRERLARPGARLDQRDAFVLERAVDEPRHLELRRAVLVAGQALGERASIAK